MGRIVGEEPDLDGLQVAERPVEDQLSGVLDRRCVAVVEPGRGLHARLLTAATISAVSSALRPAGFSIHRWRPDSATATPMSRCRWLGPQTADHVEVVARQQVAPVGVQLAEPVRLHGPGELLARVAVADRHQRGPDRQSG